MPFPSSALKLPPLPLSFVSPFDLNRNVVQYTQQDKATWYYAASQASIVFANTITATATFGLYNPIASVNNLIIRSIQIALSVEPAAVGNIFYCKVTNGVANPTGVTGITLNQGFGPIVTQGGVNFGVAATGVPFTAATLNAVPFIIRAATDVLSITSPQIAIDDQINGQIMLAPGDQFAIYNLGTASGVSAYCSMVWEEQPQW